MNMDYYLIAAASAGLVSLILLALWLITKKQNKQLQAKLKESGERFSNYYSKTEDLRKYQVIQDAQAEADRILKESRKLRNKTETDYHIKISEATKIATVEAEKIMERARHSRDQAQIEYDKKLAEARALAQSEIDGSKAKAKEIREQAEQKLQEAHITATKLEADARRKAEEIAGDAWQAKQNADQYEATVRAMKNIIQGYGDDYLIPNRSILDEIAEEFDHKEAGQELARAREIIKHMIKHGEAADCDYAEPVRRSGAIHFVLDAFNGKVDTIMSKVRHDNYGTLLQQLKDAYSLVNRNGTSFRNARINPRYFDAMLEQLKWGVAVQELKRQDQEEQRQIREQMREEERARREYEKAIKETEKEERMLQKAMVEAENRLASAAAGERAALEAKLAELHARLSEAEARGQRALSMAQQTKQGHVYVISNIGSLGENVFKIGMTRRLEPMDRVKELGDASVPFSFDVHALIYSDDAPALENNLHRFFQDYQVNKVNTKKEFFRLPIHIIKEKVDEAGIEVHWTMKAAALEYHETLQIEKRKKQESANVERLAASIH